MRAVDRIRADRTSVSPCVREKESAKAPGEKTSGAFVIVAKSVGSVIHRFERCMPAL
jgi:hypothetical protein